MFHTLWLKDIDRQIIGIQRDQVDIFQKIATDTPILPSCTCITCNACLAQEKTHPDTFLGVKNVTSLTEFYLSFTLEFYPFPLIDHLEEPVDATFKAVIIAVYMPKTLQTKCKTCFGGPRMILYGF